MKTYLVTGCSRGVGFALANALLARGDRVYGSVRGEDLPIEHKNFKALAFDVRDDGAIRWSAASIDEPIDCLINNAGIIGPKTPNAMEMDFPAFADVLDINVLGPLRVIHAFLPHLKKAKAAKVMTVSSQMGGMTYPGTNNAAYRTSKAALNKLMQCAAQDLAKDGIALVMTHPGWVRTDMGTEKADISVEESAAGLIKVVDELDISRTGRFMNWNGSERVW